MKKLIKLPKSFLGIFVLGIAAGLIAVFVFRLAAYKSNDVHYHANFNLYIDGKKDEFKGPGYYEEVQACRDDSHDPREWAHMHDSVSDVVHVHSSGVTWGQFFANLGYAVSDNAIDASGNVYVNGQNSKALTFILNGKKVDSINNTVIKSADVLLIDYGKTTDSQLQTEYSQISTSAVKYNQGSDPASCSGTKPLTFQERLKKAAGLN